MNNEPQSRQGAEKRKNGNLCPCFLRVFAPLRFVFFGMNVLRTASFVVNQFKAGPSSMRLQLDGPKPRTESIVRKPYHNDK